MAKSSMGKSKDTGKVSYERSRRLKKLKESTGLPTLKDVQAGLEKAGRLGEFEDLSMLEIIQKRISVMNDYAEANQRLVNVANAMGWDLFSTFKNVVDLQSKLWELENKLQSEGVNPLESPEYMKARELLGKEVQFLHKHGLEGAKFQANLERKKEQTNDDEVFKVESA